MDIHELVSHHIDFAPSPRQREITLFRDSAIRCYDELQAADTIDLSRLDKRTLDHIHDLAKETVREYNFSALAFTQLQPDVFADHFIGPEFRNIVYLAPDSKVEFRNYIFINSKVEVAPNTQWVRGIESCGSIEKGSLWMAVWQPSEVHVTGHIYTPSKSREPIENLKISGKAAGLLYHEYRHIQGLTVLDEPECIINTLQWSPALWNDVIDGDTRNTCPTKELRVKHWLINNEGHLEKIPPPLEFLNLVTEPDTSAKNPRFSLKHIAAALYH